MLERMEYGSEVTTDEISLGDYNGEHMGGFYSDGIWRISLRGEGGVTTDNIREAFIADGIWGARYTTDGISLGDHNGYAIGGFAADGI